MTITLTPEIEHALAARATRAGTTPELLALHDLHKLYFEGERRDETPRTGADLLALWEQEGAFLAREDLPDSPVLARQLREQSQKPRTQDGDHT